MGLDLEYIHGQTPLDEEEKLGLLIPTIATRGELDEFEQENIQRAMLWLIGKRFKQEEILSEKFIKILHKRMYGNVWSWAGQYRTTDKNIGVDKWQIPVHLKQLLDDVNFWIVNEAYAPHELAVRFKHRLVSIHCFPNGNGRHSRLMADILIEKIFNLPVFTWGAQNLSENSDFRKIYIKAVKRADLGELDDLIRFAQS